MYIKYIYCFFSVPKFMMNSLEIIELHSEAALLSQCLDFYSRTSIFIFQQDDIDLVRIFVVFGSDVNQKNSTSHSPRHVAAVSKGKNK